ncbi:MurR/RpiR family transcriptional regulator [Breznakiella homolactica]|uniref:MurR/RpiR family transcriptional regulator n=1 Tax=Breznakiella homolactica TaxID=2798577 RepID=A0A7T7XNE4_9SPIR|nr:MurR/RpiR family transcriptional regulator [Breznakiella homolactica]QQO09447.1 MurR/RpiR family transcriptional regulator [Breznakiella homolactica]
MPTSNLLKDIQSRYEHLTKVEKKVADTVLARPQDVLNATITDLAEMSGVGDTSVFRFCRSLQLDGYQDFKLSLALSTNSQNMLDVKETSVPADSDKIEDIAANVFNITSDALQDAYHILNYERISKTIDLMTAAKRIYFFGIGGSALTALEAQNKFLKITPNVYFTIDTHMQLTTASLLGEDSLAVIFSNSGTSKDSLNMAKLAKQSGAQVVFITKFEKTPARRFSDVILVSGAAEGPMQGGSISAKTAQLFIVDILFTKFFYCQGSRAVENKKITSASIITEML